MRYYDIRIDPVSSGTENRFGEVTASGSKGLRFQTHPNGLTSRPDPGALHVLMDLPVSTFDVVNGNAYLEIRGVDIATINQASNLQGAQISIQGGMGKGLPLAKPDQAGTLISGSVYRAYGNWLNTDMSLNLLIQPFTEPQTGSTYPPLVWHWQVGQDIQDAIKYTITHAMDGYTCDFSGMSGTMMGVADQAGVYQDITAFAAVLQSDSMAGNQTPGYRGIRFFVRGKTFYFYDQSSNKNPKQIQFEDMIGQPTWLGPFPYPSIMLQTVMRGDISVGDVITMPDFNQQGSNQVLTGYGTIAPTSQNITSPKDRSLFKGNFEVTRVRHIGDSRNPDGAGWVTVYEAVGQ